MSHPEGGRSSDIGSAIDRFAWLIIKDKLGDVQKVLKSSNEGKLQNAALLLLPSIVRRGPKFEEVLAKLLLVKDSITRKAFVAF